MTTLASPLTIVLVNKSTVVTDVDVTRCAEALDVQLQRDFAPYWGITGRVDAASLFLPGDLPVYILDDSDQAGALGYHDDDPTLGPFGRVFAKTDQKYHLNWTVTTSHEVLELAADPFVVSTAQINTTSYTALEVCLTGDMKISLLDGTEVAIKDLAERDEFWVYSCNSDGQVVPGRGHSARKTRKRAKITNVKLDNGEVVRCTADHRFMLRDGTYAEASSLTPGTSLMPLYRRHEPMFWAKRSKDYEQVLHPGSMQWEFTHRIVSDPCPQGSVRHHIDLNRFNNDPGNLVVVTAAAHNRLHVEHNRRMIAASTHPFQAPRSPEKSARDAIRLTAYNKSDAHRKRVRVTSAVAVAKQWKDPAFVAVHSARMRRLQPEFTERYQEQRTAGLRRPEVRAAIGKGTERTNHVRWHVRREVHGIDCPYCEANPRVEWKVAAEKAEARRLANPFLDDSTKAKYGMHLRWHERRGATNPACEFCVVVPTNHKVVAVWEDGVEDVWDITVDEHHNMALSAGIFVHNCDAVEADSDGYQIGSVQVSDFVTPAWFGAGKGPVDYRKLLTRPFTLRRGGYMSVWTVNGGWTQKTAAAPPGVTSRAQFAHRGPIRKARPEALTNDFNVAEA